MCSWACRNFYRSKFYITQNDPKISSSWLSTLWSYENFARQFKIFLNVVCHSVMTKRCLYLSMTFAQGIRGKKRKKNQCFDAGKLVLESLSHTNQSIPQSDFLYKKVLAEQQKNGIKFFVFLSSYLSTDWYSGTKWRSTKGEKKIYSLSRNGLKGVLPSY